MPESDFPESVFQSCLPPNPLGYSFEPWYNAVSVDRRCAIIRAYKIIERTPDRLTIFTFSSAKFKDGRWVPNFDDEFLETQPPIILDAPAGPNDPIVCHDRINNRLFTSLEAARRDLYREMEALDSGRDVYEQAFVDDGLVGEMEV